MAGGDGVWSTKREGENFKLDPSLAEQVVYETQITDLLLRAIGLLEEADLKKPIYWTWERLNRLECLVALDRKTILKEIVNPSGVLIEAVELGSEEKVEDEETLLDSESIGERLEDDGDVEMLQAEAGSRAPFGIMQVLIICLLAAVVLVGMCFIIPAFLVIVLFRILSEKITSCVKRIDARLNYSLIIIIVPLVKMNWLVQEAGETLVGLLIQESIALLNVWEMIKEVVLEVEGFEDALFHRVLNRAIVYHRGAARAGRAAPTHNGGGEPAWGVDERNLPDCEEHKEQVTCGRQFSSTTRGT